jgi:hypothetical protein
VAVSIFCSIPLVSLLFACSEAPKVSYETIKLQRPITIDCEGGAYNKGKVTELQILADNVTIKRCKINGSIRTIGLGHNGEAPGVKASSARQATPHERKQQHQKAPCCMPSLSLATDAFRFTSALAPLA